jgi:hypothetical protein
MLHALILAATGGGGSEAAEPSKVPFYFVGGALAAWAVILSAIGLTRPEFPFHGRGQRIVMAISAGLVAATMITAVATS